MAGALNEVRPGEPGGAPGRELREDERAARADALRATLLSGTYIEDGDPVRAGVRVIYDEFALHDAAAGRALGRVLAGRGSAEFIALEVAGAAAGRWQALRGRALPARLTACGWEDAAWSVGFGVNGLPFILCDATLAWALITAVDVQALAGAPGAILAWYEGPAGVEAARARFRARFDTVDVWPRFRAMVDRVRWS